MYLDRIAAGIVPGYAGRTHSYVAALNAVLSAEAGGVNVE
jgi:hypothetical protein